VHVRVCNGAGGTLTIKISDQGGGIPDAIQDKVGGWRFVGSWALGRRLAVSGRLELKVGWAH
jgi:hypothetical protein